MNLQIKCKYTCPGVIEALHVSSRVGGGGGVWKTYVDYRTSTVKSITSLTDTYEYTIFTDINSLKTRVVGRLSTQKLRLA